MAPVVPTWLQGPPDESARWRMKPDSVVELSRQLRLICVAEMARHESAEGAGGGAGRACTGAHNSSPKTTTIHDNKTTDLFMYFT